MLIEDPPQLLCRLWLRPAGLVKWGNKSKPHSDEYSWEEECVWKMPTFPPSQICLHNKQIKAKEIPVNSVRIPIVNKENIEPGSR